MWIHHGPPMAMSNSSGCLPYIREVTVQSKKHKRDKTKFTHYMIVFLYCKKKNSRNYYNILATGICVHFVQSSGLKSVCRFGQLIQCCIFIVAIYNFKAALTVAPRQEKCSIFGNWTWHCLLRTWYIQFRWTTGKGIISMLSGTLHVQCKSQGNIYTPL